MKTVINNIYEMIIKKSKFITLIYNVTNKEEIDFYLKKVKDEYSDSTHICYAYIIGSMEKYNDDNEPSGTAGRPILNILKKEGINNVLCIVVRYFGGIKLGTGGLTRAYSKACKEAIISKNLEKGFKIKITFDYNDIKKIDYLLKNSNIIEKIYDSKTSYIFMVSENNYKKIEEEINQRSSIDKKENILM